MRQLLSVLFSTLQGGVRGGLLLLLLVASVRVIYASNTQVGGIWYDFDSSTKTASVTYRGYDDDSYDGEYSGAVVIPETVTYYGSTYSVTSIGDYAFEGCIYLTSVTIPESVTSIGYAAFYYCNSLTSVTIPESVTSIGESAFENCSKLTSVTINSDAIVSSKYYSYDDNISDIFGSQVTEYIIGESVTSIGHSAFEGCSSLTSIVIPNSVTSIGHSAFEGCSSLTSIVIPNSVTSIGNSAFSNCSSLTSITIPNSVTSIGYNAFEGCSSLTSVTIGNSVTSIGHDAFRGTGIYNDNSNWENDVLYIDNCLIDAKEQISGTYTIKENTRLIAANAFYNCSSLASITIPNSVTSIGTNAFYNCSSLASITIPNSVTSIGYNAFGYCSSLTSVFVEEGNTIYDSRDNCNAIIETITNTLILGCQNTIIPNSVISIGTNAFYNCYSLASITIPNSVTSIGYKAFGYCSSLTSVTIGNSVTSIEIYAFSNCTSLTSITCEAETPPTVGTDAFYGVSKSIPVYVPCGCTSAYKRVFGWIFTNIQVPLAEYSIEVNVNDTIMGSAKVDKNTACGNQISATANYGYHFVRWSDGNTDNPRSLILTQDTTLTAEFALNTYTISTQCNYTERGTTSGDVTTTYLDYVTISATANYGYHFSHWNDYNYDNPRQVQVTGDKTYTATFDKNTYAISLSCNEEQGSVEGVTSAEYLDTVTISATPNLGYHFVQWNDGNTENPRTLELTQDTILTAEFAQSFFGQCGDNLYWSYDETAKTITITGSGKMYDYTADTQPWLLFKEQIVEVTTTNTVTSIGTSAFEGCARLGKISLGTGLEEIAANAFAGCTRLYDVYCYATNPPFAEQSSFANYNVYLYVPCESQRNYTLDIVWGNFKFIECIESEDVTTDGVIITPSTNDVTITWPTEDNAENYTIVIEKDGEVFCTLTFNADGQLLNIAFAPSRDGNNRPVQYAEQAVNGYRFTVTGLEEGTHYAYNIDVKDAADKTIKSYTGEFTTESTTAVENTHSQSPIINCQKIIRDGQLYIYHNDKTYNTVGQIVE